MDGRLSEFVKRVRRRNTYESAAGLVLLVIFAFALYVRPDSILAVSGFAVGIAATLLILAVIWSRLHIAASDLSDFPPSLYHSLWRNHMTTQARFLRLAWLWYVLPLGVAVSLLVLADGGGLNAVVGVLLAVIVMGAAALTWLNVKTARSIEKERDAMFGPPVTG